MLLTGLLNSLSSFAKQLTVKKFLRYKTHVPYCCKIQVHQHAFTLLKSIYGIPAKIQLHIREWVGALPCLYSLFSFCLFFLYLSSSPSSSLRFFRRHLPPSAHLQGTNIWEMQFEHFSATKKRQTMLEKRGDKHVAELMLDKHVAFFSNSQMALLRSELAGVEIQGQTWLCPWLLLLFLGLFACCVCLYYCSFLEGYGPLKWQERNGCS